MGYMDVGDHAIIIDATAESKQNRSDGAGHIPAMFQKVL
jgi:hypothetical protein